MPGAVIGLEPAGRPGFRVRHRDFAGRVDRIGPRSGPLDRLDSRFVVRAGLTGDGCVAFESVNYPGRYLRHQNFVVRLHPPDRTALFAADATFCEVPRGRGRIALRSVNYPDRFVAAAPDDVLRLLPAGGEVPAFRVRPPL